MWGKMKPTLLLASLAGYVTTSVNAQVTTQVDVFPPLAEPLMLWESQIEATGSSSSGSVLAGNGAYLTPGEAHVITTSVGGTLTAFDAFNGNMAWEYNPPAVAGGIISCKSGVTFASPDSSPYIIYTIIDNENSVEAFSRVVAVGLDGTEKWVSEQVEGVAPGTPVASGDGEYVFLTHNSVFGTVGHFTIISSSMNGVVTSSQEYTENPFAPLGIYHNPAEGYYDGGAGNTNDIMVWSVQPKPDDQVIGQGAIFAYQFPISFPNVDAGNFTLMGSEQFGTLSRDFQAIAPPVLANEGRSLYFSHSRSGFTCWIGIAGLMRRYFSRGPDMTQGFTRGVPAGQPVFAPLALSSDPAQPFLFGGTAAAEFVRMNFDMSQRQVIGTSSLIHTQAKVAPGDASVYYVEMNGIVHNAAFDNIQDIWTHTLQGQVMGQFALRSNGSTLYVADVTGLLTALQVTEIPFTPEPTPTPTSFPSDSPSMAPVVPTDLPTMSPMEAPLPTEAPVGGTPAPAVPSTDENASGASRQMWKFALAAAAAIGLIAC